jgi:hypothetical protein
MYLTKETKYGGDATHSQADIRIDDQDISHHNKSNRDLARTLDEHTSKNA